MPSTSRSSQAASRSSKAGSSREAIETSSQGANRDGRASSKRTSAGTNGFRRTMFATRPISSSSSLKQTTLSFGSLPASQSSRQGQSHSQSQNGVSNGKSKSVTDLTELSSDSADDASDSPDPPARASASSIKSGIKRKRSRIIESQESSQGTQKAPVRALDTHVDVPAADDDIDDDISWDKIEARGNSDLPSSESKPTAPTYAASTSTQPTSPPPAVDPFAGLWSDLYAPTTRAELCLHKNKYAQVENWLREAFDGPDQLRKYRRLLALSGPSGSCKSTLVKVLSSEDELDFDIVGFGSSTHGQDSSGVEGVSGGEAQGYRGGSSMATGLTEKFAEFALNASYDRRLAFTQAPVEESASTRIHPSLAMQAPGIHAAAVQKNVRFAAAPDTSAESSMQAQAQRIPTSRRRKVILVEDFPNLSHQGTKESFQASLEALLRSPLQPDKKLLADRQQGVKTTGVLINVPIIVVVSESTPKTSEDSWAAAGGDGGKAGGWRDRMSNTWDVRSVLGDAIRNHPGFAEVKFNPIATTIMKPGLRRIVSHALSTVTDSTLDRSQSPVRDKGKGRGKAKADDKRSELQKIANMLCDEVSKHSDGDLRSAINALQMALRMAVTGSGEMDLEDIATSSSSKRQKLSATKSAAKNKVTLSAHVARLMSLVTERETSLALWHAIGKILYNKRAGEEKDEAEREMMRELAERMGPEDPPLPQHLAHLKRRLSMVDVEAIWSQVSCEPSSFQLFLHHNYPQFCDEIDESADIMEQYSYADSQLHPVHEGWQSAALSSYYGFLVSSRGTLLHLPAPVSRRGQVLKNAHFWKAGKDSKKFVEGLLDAQTFLLNKARPKSAASSGVDTSTAAADLKTFSSSSMSELAMEIVPMLAKIKSLDGHPLPNSLSSLGRMKLDFFSHAQRDTAEELANADLSGEDDDDGNAIGPTTSMASGMRLNVRKTDAIRQNDLHEAFYAGGFEGEQEVGDVLVEGDDISDFEE